MQSSYALACSGHDCLLLVGKKAGYRADALFTHYGLTPHAHFQLRQLPFLQWEGRLRVSWRGLFNGCLLWTLYRLVNTQTIDWLLISDLPTARFVLRYRRLLSIPIVYECHELRALGMEQRAQAAHPQERHLFQQVDAIITTTQMLAEAIQRIYHVPAPRAVIPLATYTQPQLVTPPPRAAGAPVRVCYIGQLYPLQGVDILIRAIGQIKNAVLTVIGGAAGDIESLRPLTVQEAVADRVRFHGFVPPAQVSRLASDADMLVMPARNRGRMPYVAHTKLYEYLGLGKPIVASDLPSVREVLRHGENALLVEPENVSTLAEAITRIATDRQLACSLAAQARRDAGNYSWEKRSELVTAFLQRVR
ncbi:MAG: glycosyltransferase family 4 protein [Candidatus Entotheonellia bacterium]